MNRAALESVIQGSVDRHRGKPGPLLVILHDLQAQWGYVPDEAVPLLAEALTLTRAEIHGVISFYHDFRTTPGGRHQVQVCRAEACQAQGGRQLEAAVREHLGIDWHDTSADGMVTLEPVYCLGNCATGPAVRIDDAILGRVTPDRMRTLLDDLQREPVNISGLMTEAPHG
ncbi:MAG: formate dehydrogenase subunit gamma [Natronospirillum sp.]|uniref:formate dehydrogenase subunit gamma n=1 Tax=Natronospirillum sp. TaxID=2812955 RepID=UPI0025E5955D|nr:formate dehydrogenase subunit gamma [Natronospirillum sp.]MCH8551126.1 formate dehydrogenase subunit gamma [Natronospirillum sp.]